MQGIYTENNNLARSKVTETYPPNVLQGVDKFSQIVEAMKYDEKFPLTSARAIFTLYRDEINFIMNNLEHIKRFHNGGFSLSRNDLKLFAKMKTENENKYLHFKCDLANLLRICQKPTNMENENYDSLMLQLRISDLISQYLYHNYIQL
jgi:hypothetical protein